MSNQSNGRKISQFLQATSFPSDAKLTFISGGVNYQIAFSDFVSDLGVTGTIVQDGAVTGTPVLDVSGTVNYIRNLEAGSGVRTSVSPENGITIEHGFQQDTAGVTILDDISASQPKFRSFTAGVGLNVAVDGDSIKFDLTATPATTKTIIINSLSDFPAPVAGVITLDEYTEYLIRNDITTTNRFIIKRGTVISSSDPAVVALTYTGVDTMFTGISASDGYTFKGITLNAANGTMFDLQCGSSGVSKIEDCELIGKLLGAFKTHGGFYMVGSVISFGTDGFDFSGAGGVLLVDAVKFQSGAGSIFDLTTSTWDGVSFTDCFCELLGTSYFLSGLASSGNINSGGLGSVHNCRFTGAGTPLNTISTADARWQFFINDKIIDTHTDCSMYQRNNAVNTVISVATTAVKLAGTWTQNHASRFTTDATGKMTYTGEKDFHASITFAMSAEPVSGTNKELEFYVAVNGAIVAATGTPAIVSAGDKERIVVVWKAILSTSDYVEVFVANNTDTVDVLVSDAVLRID